jgi:hypothetical protein
LPLPDSCPFSRGLDIDDGKTAISVLSVITGLLNNVSDRIPCPSVETIPRWLRSAKSKRAACDCKRPVSFLVAGGGNHSQVVAVRGQIPAKALGRVTLPIRAVDR